MTAGGRADYLVGGFRISIGSDSNTPGPRTHIVNFVEALETAGIDVTLTLASSLPFLGRFARVRQSDYGGVSAAKVRVADAVRVTAGLWSGCCTFVRTARSPRPHFIYERAAVLQSLTSFHRWKRSTIRVVEANGILSRETAHDRKVLRAEKLAASIERHVLRRADLVVSVSQPLAEEIVRFAAVEPSKILVLPNGVRKSLTRVPRTPRVPGQVVIGFVGSVVAWQHLDVFFAAVKACEAQILRETGSRISVEIVGEGGDLERLQSLCREEGWENIAFLGRLSHSEAVERIARWHVGFAGHTKSSSSEMYHSPLKIYEYAALGLSVVCTPSGDAAALQSSGSDVHIFTDQSALPAALRAALARATSDDEPRIRAQRESVAAHHSWDARVEEFLQRLTHVTRSRGAIRRRARVDLAPL
ncbi:glycosyltransferase [Microbacterium sp. 1P10UB]|uniref:glycosyltransferase n=1 Tax=unclassified Microbacterium TaxID=2609290 RepID=UPI0039A2B591